MKCGLDFKAYSIYVRRKKAGENVMPPTPPTPTTHATAPAQNNMVADTPETKRPMELEELFRQTWDEFKKRWGTLITLNILYIVTIVVSMLPAVLIVPMLLADPDPITIAIASGLYIIAVIAIALMTMGTMFAASADNSLGVGGSIATGFKKGIPFVWVMILQGFIVSGGLLIFAIPGFIFMTWFIFAPYMVFTENARGMNALMKSRELVRGHGWDVFFKLFVIFIFYMIANAVPIIGPLIFFPFMLLYIKIMYSDMTRLSSKRAPEPASLWAKLKYPAVGLAGYMIPIAIAIAILLPLIGTLKSLKQTEIFVTPEAPQSQTVIKTDKDIYGNQESITVHYAGMPGNAHDWITIVRARASDDTYSAYLNTDGKAEGQMEFKGLAPGKYEARAFHDYPEGGYKVMARYAFEVEAANSLLTLEKKTYSPGDEISVWFSVPEDFSDYAWAAIVPATLPHGDEKLNRDNANVFQLLGGQIKGYLKFVAPVEPGSYDIRLHTSQGGKEVDHVSFTVKDNSSPEMVRIKATSNKPIRVMVQISSINYNASITLGDMLIYTSDNEPDTIREQTIPATLISGRNVLTITHNALPDAWRTQMKIRVYEPTDDGGERELASWSVFAPTGTRSFTIIVEGAGISA